MPSVYRFAGNRVKLYQHRGVVDRLDDGRGDHPFRGAGPENGAVGVETVARQTDHRALKHRIRN